MNANMRILLEYSLNFSPALVQATSAYSNGRVGTPSYHDLVHSMPRCETVERCGMAQPPDSREWGAQLAVGSTFSLHTNEFIHVFSEA